MALKSVDDVDDGGFDDEISSTKIAYFAKNFRDRKSTRLNSSHSSPSRMPSSA